LSLRSPDASWHADYRDTAYVYIGGLPFELSEGDIITIFSQFGEPTYVNLIRDKETGKSKGFAFLKYEDQRSTDLAVDNLGGATIMNRIIRVDHTRYKKREDEVEDDQGHRDSINAAAAIKDDERQRHKPGEDGDAESERPMLREEHELAILIRDHDDDDPMKAFLIQEKKEEISAMLAKLKDGKIPRSDRKSKDRHHHHRHHRSHRSGGLDERDDRKRRSHRRRDEYERRRSHSKD